MIPIKNCIGSKWVSLRISTEAKKVIKILKFKIICTRVGLVVRDIAL